MGQAIKDAATAAEAEMSQTPALGAHESHALQKLVGRVYQCSNDDFETVGDLEASFAGDSVTVEKVKRGGSFLDVSPSLQLRNGDWILLIGQRDALVAGAGRVGPEVARPIDMNLVMKTQEVVVTGNAFDELTLEEIHGSMRDQIRHGVYLLSISREGREIPLAGDGHIRHGDIMRLYGAEGDLSRVSAAIGAPIVPSAKTDMILIGLGVVIGLLIGMLTLNVGGIPLTLGSGGGALLSGLFFGWMKGKRPQLGGAIPSAASELLKDFGLAGFVAIVGLDSGLQAISTIQEHGLAVLLGGLIVTLVPLLVTMLLGRYLLGYSNSAVFAGALSGARSANPAFGQILGLAGNSAPTVPFAVTYALANDFLTLLGPLVVALV
jgi:AspT/YidE/YbjL antiporter-like protein